MQFIYLLTVVILSPVFIWRQIDIFSIAFFSAIIYFIPGLYPIYEVESQAYILWSVFLVMIAFGKIAEGSSAENILLDFRKSMVCYARRHFRFFSFFSVVIPIALFLAIGPAAFFSDKLQASSRYPQEIYYIWVVLLGYATLLSHFAGKRNYLFLCLAQYIIIIASGDRTQISILIFSVLIASAYSMQIKPVELFKNIKFVFVFAFLFLIVVFGKWFYGYVQLQYQGLDTGGHAFLLDVESLIATLEPYHTQLILNLSLKSNIDFDLSYLYSIPVQLLPFSGALGADVHAQSNIIKHAFFGDWSDSSGVSSNIIAEFYLIGGLFGSMFFFFLFSLGLVIFHRLLLRARGLFAVTLPFMASFYSFYIHRNSILQMIGHEKRYVYITLVLVVFISIKSVIRRKFVENKFFDVG